MTKKDYILIAEAISILPEMTGKTLLIETLSSAMKKENPAFNKATFEKAARGSVVITGRELAFSKRSFYSVLSDRETFSPLDRSSIVEELDEANAKESFRQYDLRALLQRLKPEDFAACEIPLSDKTFSEIAES